MGDTLTREELVLLEPHRSIVDLTVAERQPEQLDLLGLMDPGDAIPPQVVGSYFFG